MPAPFGVGAALKAIGGAAKSVVGTAVGAGIGSGISSGIGARLSRNIGGAHHPTSYSPAYATHRAMQMQAAREQSNNAFRTEPAKMRAFQGKENALDREQRDRETMSQERIARLNLAARLYQIRTMETRDAEIAKARRSDRAFRDSSAWSRYEQNLFGKGNRPITTGAQRFPQAVLESVLSGPFGTAAQGAADFVHKRKYRSGGW